MSTTEHIIGMIEKSDVSSEDCWTGFIEKVSELLFGDDGEGDREPNTIDEALERLQEFSKKSQAWDDLYPEVVNQDEMSQEQWELLEKMDHILKEL